jgi:hypothetical protein
LTNNGGCTANAVCYNGFAVDTPVTCVCKPNFFPTSSASGPSLVCVGVNVCATNNGGCHAQATCATTVGTWDKTCTCKAGFQGDGYYCAPPSTSNPPPTNSSFNWDWEYPAPVCGAGLTVTYPADIPAGQANDVNIRIRLPNGELRTYNFHNNGGFWSGVTHFVLETHPQFIIDRVTSYTIVWVQVGGTNYKWTGTVACGCLASAEGTCH